MLVTAAFSAQLTKSEAINLMQNASLTKKAAH